jgi:hypothetical protein
LMIGVSPQSRQHWAENDSLAWSELTMDYVCQVM